MATAKGKCRLGDKKKPRHDKKKTAPSGISEKWQQRLDRAYQQYWKHKKILILACMDAILTPDSDAILLDMAVCALDKENEHVARFAKALVNKEELEDLLSDEDVQEELAKDDDDDEEEMTLADIKDDEHPAVSQRRTYGATGEGDERRRK